MPRTQTNDPALAIKGIPTTFWALSSISTGTQLAENDESYALLVITNIDVVEVSGTTSSSILIGGIETGVGLFGAQTGSGNYDTFSWRGFLTLTFGQILSVIHADAGWHSIGAGFWIPNFFAAT